MAIRASAAITLSGVVDVQSTTRYYLLQSSTLSPPARPTAKPPAGAWDDTEPGYASGSTNTLYFTDLTVFSDGTWAYSAVSASSAYEAAKAAWNQAAAARQAAEQALSSVECVVGTQTAATNAWTGRASFAGLADGQVILYWLPYAGTGTAATLNLTLSGGGATGAKNVYIDSTTRCTTHVSAGNMVQMIYRENVAIGTATYTGWWISRAINSNNYDRIRLNNVVKAKSAISASRLIVSDAGGYFHLAAGSAFSVDRPILWAGSAIAAGATGSNNYLSLPGCTLRNNAGSSWTATQYATLYLAGTLGGNTFTVAASDWLTTAPADANLTYISLGYMYSTYQMYLYPEHPMYRIVDGALKAVSQIAWEAQAAAAEALEAVDDLDGALDQEEIFNRLTDNGAAQGLFLENGKVYVNADYIAAGRLRADRIDLNTYDSYFRVPDENDPDTLLDGQSISDGWIVGTGEVLWIPDARPVRGMTVTVSAVSKDGAPGGGTVIYECEPTGGAFIGERVEEAWANRTSAGQVDADGSLVGSTKEGAYARYARTFTIPDNADTYRVYYGSSGLKNINVDFGLAASLNLRYGNNIGLSYKGLQVGKFVVDRTGNVTAGGENLFNGNVTLASPLPVGSGGTGAGNAAGARSNLGVAALVTLASTDTAATVYTKLNAAMPAAGNVAIAYAPSDVASLLTGGKCTSNLICVIRRFGSNVFSFFGAANTGTDIYAFRSTVASSGITADYDVYKFSGTKL